VTRSNPGGFFRITAYRERHTLTTPGADLRSPGRRLRDEQIAAEPPLAAPELPADAAPSPMEVHLGRCRRRPVALAGIVENGLVRPLDTTVKLPEHSRVIIVASEEMGTSWRTVSAGNPGISLRTDDGGAMPQPLLGTGIGHGCDGRGGGRGSPCGWGRTDGGPVPASRERPGFGTGSLVERVRAEVRKRHSLPDRLQCLRPSASSAHDP
jgi:hypothetical protein